MTNQQRIYLDNAATSWPKPPGVYEAAEHYLRQIGAPNGRSGYREALESNRIVERARHGVAELVGGSAGEIVFGFSGTDVLNLAIRGLVRPGDHVVTTVCDHNSVLRPLRALSETLKVEVSYVRCDGAGFVSPDDVRKAIRANTRLVAVVHASNVTGAIQPAAEIARIVRETDAYMLLDAAQSLGHVPIDVRQLDVDLLAAPGHKGLLAPLGTGVLYIRKGVERELIPLRYGGTGTQSDEDRQPDEMPDKYEPGNHNLVGLAGMVAAVEFLRNEGIEEIENHHRRLTVRLLEALDDIASVTVHGPRLAGDRTSVVSISVEGYDPQEMAAVLEASHGIQSRAGLHCAPRMHAALGTTSRGGTLRLSPGFATTIEEIDEVATAIGEIAAVSA
jgi:cysteine desulfurase / selenocysteine lyase